MLKNFLVAADGSEGSAKAARLAAQMASPRGQLLLLHVMPHLGATALSALDALTAAIGGAQGGLAEEWRQKAAREGSALLEEARRQVASTTVSTVDLHTELETGRPASVILERLEHGAFDALAIGSRGHGILAHTLLGSVASEALLYSSKAVLTARTHEVKRILVPSDGSPASIRAAEAAGHIARELDATVSIVTAVELPVDAAGEQRDLVESALHSHFQDTLKDVRQALGVQPREQKLLFRDPVAAILEEVARDQIDLVVVGRRRAQAAPIARIGSVAYRVAMTSPSSVLVIP